MARAGAVVRAAYTREVCTYIDLVLKLIAHLPDHERTTAATSALATLVGAVAMSRAVNDDVLSREILSSAARELKKRLAKSFQPSINSPRSSSRRPSRPD